MTTPSPQAPAGLTINPRRTAVLIMDYQYKQLGGQPAASREVLLKKAAGVLSTARAKKIAVMYIEVRDRKGPPAFRPWDTARRQASGREDLGQRPHDFEIHPAVRPQPGEAVFTKRRIGPFSTTELNEELVRRKIETLVLMGISTGGVVLSTVRWAADVDYELIVIGNCCADMDPEVHRVLVEKVIPRQAAVISSEDFERIIPASNS